MALDSTTTEPIMPAHPQDIPADDAQLDTSASVDESQPVADQETETTSQTSETVDAAPDEAKTSEDNADDTELKDWAAKKNLPLDDPLKIAKMYRDAERELGKKGSQEGQLKTAVTDANTEAGVDDIQALKNEVQALSFYIQHPEAKQYETQMVNILDEKPWLAGDLDLVLDVAKGRAATDSERLVAERQAGAKEALKTAESARRASAPRASATQPGYESGRITPDNVDSQIAAHMGDVKWYNDHKAEIDAALAM